MNWLHALYQDKFWILSIFAVIFFTATLHALEAILYRKIRKKVSKTKNFWDITCVAAIHRPLALLIWVLGIGFAADIAAKTVAENIAIFNLITPIRELSILIIVAWFFIRFVRQAEKHYVLNAQKQKKKVDTTLLHAVRQLVTVSIMITAALVAMQMFGLPISGLLAFGGIGGIGISLAAQNVLGNFFGGLMIYLDRPFNVGDWIRSPDKEIEGVVEYIGWRLTRIRTFDKRPLYVPNGVFATIAVENPSRMTNRRIKVDIGVRYEDAGKMRDMLQAIDTMLRDHPEIDTNQVLMVNLIEFSPSALTFMIYTFTKTTDWVRFQAIQQDVFLKVVDIVEGHGAQFAYPTRTVHLPNTVPVPQMKGIMQHADP